MTEEEIKIEQKLIKELEAKHSKLCWEEVEGVLKKWNREIISIQGDSQVVLKPIK